MPSPLRLEERMAYVEGRADEHAEAVKSLRGDMTDLRGEMADLRGEMNRRFEVLDQKVDRHFMWLVGVQVATFIALVGTIVGTVIPLYFR